MRIKRVKASQIKELVPRLKKDANKYTRGKLIVLGGSNEYPGAACLASAAALKCGAGYVEAYCEEKSVPVLRAFDPNLVVRDWSDFSCSDLGLDECIEDHPKACLIGPGFNLDGEKQERLLQDVIERCAYPIVIDAGALCVLAKPSFLQIAKRRHDRGRETLLTPHYGEAARLALPLDQKPPSQKFADIEKDAEFAQALSASYGAILVLKDRLTLIADARSDTHSAEFFLMDKGPACLAKAGTGDVLAGMTAAFMAQGVPGIDAARLSTFIHARAAALAEEELTDVSVCATDVISHIPCAFKTYK